MHLDENGNQVFNIDEMRQIYGPDFDKQLAQAKAQSGDGSSSNSGGITIGDKTFTPEELERMSKAQSTQKRRPDGGKFGEMKEITPQEKARRRLHKKLGKKTRQMNRRKLKK